MRRFFKSFQQGVGSIGVHVISAIHQTDAPAACPCAFLEESRSPAGLVNGDLGAPALAFLVPGAPQEQQIRAGLGFQLAADRVGRIGTQRPVIGERCSTQNAPQVSVLLGFASSYEYCSE